MIKKFWKTKIKEFPFCIDGIEGDFIKGWALNNVTFGKVRIDFCQGDKTLSSAVADEYRGDLQVANFSDFSCGFSIHAGLVDTENKEFSVKFNGDINSRATAEVNTILKNKIHAPVVVPATENVDTGELEKTIKWLEKNRIEDLLEIKNLRAINSLYEDYFFNNDVLKLSSHLLFGQINVLKDKFEFDKMLGSRMPFDEKKKAFCYLARQFMLRDLEHNNMPLQFKLSNSPKVSVILVLYNKAELTYKCLRSLVENLDLEYEIIVVDNASSDETEQLLNGVEGVIYVRNEVNSGFLLACNQASKLARGEYILLLNNDAMVHKGSIETAVKTYESADSVGVVGAKILHLDGKLQEAGSIIWNDGSCLGYGRRQNAHESQYNFMREVDYVSGAFLLISKALWDELDGLDESYAPCYYEETDLCVRLKLLGLRVIFQPKSVITHFEFGSSSGFELPKSQMSKNQGLFKSKYPDFLSKKFESCTQNIHRAALSTAKRKIVYMDDQVPYDELGAGFPRARKIIKELKKYGDVVLFPFLESSIDHQDPFFDDMLILPTEPKLSGEILRGISPDVELFWVSRPHNIRKLQDYGWLDFVAEKLTYDAEALFSEREMLRHELYELEFDNNIIEEELGLIELAKNIVSVSENEKSKIINKCPSKNVFVVGHPMPQPSFNKKRKTNSIIFVGNLCGEPNTSPNVDSIDNFIEKSYKTLLKFKLELILVGAIDEKNKEKWDRVGIQITGPVENLDKFFDKAICSIAPTRFAAGLPHKVHESLSKGVPVFATELILKQCGIQVEEKYGLITPTFIEYLSNMTIEDRSELFYSQYQYCKSDMSEERFKNVIPEIIDSSKV
ncbi:MAG: GT2 family glycosyltransferase [Oleiphilaceae bacterium]|jgi:GT2 family glycosyltransferase